MSTAIEAPAAPPKRRRGHENVRDMLLSMAACTAIIVPVWFLAQPPASDSKGIRPVDPTTDVRAFGRAAPAVPAPQRVPAGWTATSSTLDATSLRIGYVVPGDGYVEYAARAGTPGTFVEDQTGRGTPGGTLIAGGRRFSVYSAGGHTSLVSTTPQGTVVLGGLRETADDALLTTLAGQLPPAR